MPALTRDEILARKLSEERVTLADGNYVVVRPLKRAEVLQIKDLESALERDNYIISAGLVEPKLSVEEVAALDDIMMAADLAAISMRIGEISGLMEDSAKAVTKSAARPRRRS